MARLMRDAQNFTRRRTARRSKTVPSAEWHWRHEINFGRRRRFMAYRDGFANRVKELRWQRKGWHLSTGLLGDGVTR